MAAMPRHSRASASSCWRGCTSTTGSASSTTRARRSLRSSRALTPPSPPIARDRVADPHQPARPPVHFRAQRRARVADALLHLPDAVADALVLEVLVDARDLADAL